MQFQQDKKREHVIDILLIIHEENTFLAQYIQQFL